jgi:hypothetical protein
MIMKKYLTISLLGTVILNFSLIGTALSQGATFTEDFETGSPSPAWGLFRAGEEMVTAVDMSSAPAALPDGGNYVGHLQDIDVSYNGAAIALAGETSSQNYSIEGDVYCYVNHPGGSAYTGLVVYSDSSAGTYIKLATDFDGDQRFRLYNNHLDTQTFQYTFHHQFEAADVPGGIPTQDGWHHMKVEVLTEGDSTAFWCYFDGQMLAGCPIYDTSEHRMSSGQFGLYAFQMDNDGIAGYFDNIVVKSYGAVTSVEERLPIVLPTIPKDSRLSQNYPNPFNPETNISYQIMTNEFVSLTVYDVLGRKIKTLVSEAQAPGYYTVFWKGQDENGQRMPSGFYLYTLKTSSFVETKKMLMAK